MKNIFLVLITVFALTSCQQQKIGFIDNGKVINDYQEKIDLEAKFKAKDEAFKRKADSIGKAFQLEVQNYQINGSKMSTKKRQETEQVLGQKQQMLQQQFQGEDQQIKQAFQTEIDSVITKVKDFVSEYGKTNGYTYILGKNEAGSVMYGSEANDLTKAVTDALNEVYKKK